MLLLCWQCLRQKRMHTILMHSLDHRWPPPDVWVERYTLKWEVSEHERFRSAVFRKKASNWSRQKSFGVHRRFDVFIKTAACDSTFDLNPSCNSWSQLQQDTVRYRLTVIVSTKTAKHRITQSTLYNSPRIVFLKPKILAKFQWGDPKPGQQLRCGRLKSVIFDKYLAISQKRCKIGT